MGLRVQAFAGGVNLIDGRAEVYAVLTRDEALDLAHSLTAELQLPAPFIPRQTWLVRLREWWAMRFPTPARRLQLTNARNRAERLMGILKP